MANSLIEKAKNGDVRAAKELFDRAWGRPIQSIDVTTEPKLNEQYVQKDEHVNVAIKAYMTPLSTTAGSKLFTS